MKLTLAIFLITFSYLSFAQNANEVCALNIGSEIPSAKVKSTEGKEVDIKTVTSEEPTVIVFYRGGWCPYCTRHLSDIRKVESEIKDLGYQVVALSTDDVKDIPETLKKEKLSYDLYSDRNYEAMKAFGIAFKPTKKRLPVYARVMKMLEKDILVPVPAIFVVKDGVIQYRYVNPEYSTRISSEMLIAALKSIK